MKGNRISTFMESIGFFPSYLNDSDLPDLSKWHGNPPDMVGGFSCRESAGSTGHEVHWYVQLWLVMRNSKRPTAMCWDLVLAVGLHVFSWKFQKRISIIGSPFLSQLNPKFHVSLSVLFRKLLVQKKSPPNFRPRTMTWHDHHDAALASFSPMFQLLIRRNGSCFPGENWAKRLPSAWRFTKSLWICQVQEKLKTLA